MEAAELPSLKFKDQAHSGLDHPAPSIQDQAPQVCLRLAEARGRVPHRQLGVTITPSAWVLMKRDIWTQTHRGTT